jgi:hypothetical protein
MRNCDDTPTIVPDGDDDDYVVIEEWQPLKRKSEKVEAEQLELKINKVGDLKVKCKIENCTKEWLISAKDFKDVYNSSFKNQYSHIQGHWKKTKVTHGPMDKFLGKASVEDSSQKRTTSILIHNFIIILVVKKFNHSTNLWSR